MKSIKEKQFLVNLAKALGQNADPNLVKEINSFNSIKRDAHESIKRSALKDLTEAFKGAKLENEVRQIIEYPLPPTLDEALTLIEEEKPKNELVQTQSEKTSIAEESLTPIPEPTLAERAAKFISEAPKDSFQQPNPDPVTKNFDAIQAKLKFLEQAIGKIAVSGPGGGAVNLKDLDDVSKYSIKNATENQYLTYNAQSKLWIATNHTNTNLYLNDLVDVVITAPQNGQVLKYDTIANAWVAAADISVTQNGAPVISFSDLTVATLSPTEGGTLQYNSNTGVFSHAPSILDTLDSVTTRGNVTTNGISVNAVSIPVGSLLSGSDSIIASILNEDLNAILEYGNVASLSIGNYGLTNGITGVPYAVYQLKTAPNISLQVGDIVGGAAVPSFSAILAIGTGANANVFVTNTTFAANAAIPPANTVLTFARAITNAGLALSTQANTDITLNPGIGGHIVPHADIIPYTTNQWSLGTPARRFKEVWLGTGTIYVEDETLGNDQALGARGGNFYIAGGAGLEVGKFTLTGNTIALNNSQEDFYIGTTFATGNLIFNRPVQVKRNTGTSAFAITRNGQLEIRSSYQDPSKISVVTIIGNDEGNYVPPTNPGGMLHITGHDNVVSRINNDSFGSGNVYSQFVGRSAAGTAASPVAKGPGTMSRFAGSPYCDVGGFSLPGRAPSTYIDMVNDANLASNTNRQSHMEFWVTPPAAYDAVQVLNIRSTGLVLPANINILFGDNSIQTTAFTTFTVNAWVRPMLTTANVIETSSNLYYTVARVNVAVRPMLTTANVIETTGNLYFTNTRVVAALSSDKHLIVNANGQIAANVYATKRSMSNITLFGSFWDNTTQSCNANTATIIRLGSTDGKYGINLSNANTHIVFTESGVYNIQFSAQLTNSDNQSSQAFIWFRKNGTDIADSASVVTVPAKHAKGDGATLAAWNYFITINNPNEYAELAWFTPDETKVQIRADVAANLVVGVSPPIPRIPSVIVTVSHVI
jgi:hypothetical protein